MISRSVPSYSPIARARPTADGPPVQFAHGPSDRASGSPHRSQIGGVIGRIAPQQVPQTQPESGSSRSALHTAHIGARSAATNPFAASLALLGIRDLRLGIRSVTGITVPRLSRMLRVQSYFQ